MSHRDHVLNERQDEAYCECGQMIRNEDLDRPCPMDRENAVVEDPSSVEVRQLDQAWRLLGYDLVGDEADAWQRLDQLIRRAHPPSVARAAVGVGGFLRFAERDGWPAPTRRAVRELVTRLVDHAISDPRDIDVWREGLLRTERDVDPAKEPPARRRRTRQAR